MVNTHLGGFHAREKYLPRYFSPWPYLLRFESQKLTEIQILMKVHSCYTTRDNAEVTLRHAVVVVPVST